MIGPLLTDLLHRHIRYEGYHVICHCDHEPRLVRVLPRHNFYVVTWLEPLPHAPCRQLDLLPINVHPYCANRHDVARYFLHDTVNAHLLAFEYFYVISWLQHCDRRLSRRLRNDGQIHGGLRLRTVLATCESSDLIECRIHVLEHETAQLEVLFDESVLVGVVLEHVHLIPFRNSLPPVYLHHLLEVEGSLRWPHSHGACTARPCLFTLPTLALLAGIQVNARDELEPDVFAILCNVHHLRKVTLILTPANTDPAARGDRQILLFDLQEAGHFIDRGEHDPPREGHADKS